MLHEVCVDWVCNVLATPIAQELKKTSAVLSRISEYVQCSRLLLASLGVWKPGKW